MGVGELDGRKPYECMSIRNNDERCQNEHVLYTLIGSFSPHSLAFWIWEQKEERPSVGKIISGFKVVA